MNTPRIVIFNDTHGWHSERLTTALQNIGLETVWSDLAACRIDLDSPSGLYIPGFEHELPAAALVRGIAPGTLEQITLRMDVLHTLAELGVPVLNPASAIEHTVDKARTSLRLHLAGIPTPRTWACENRDMAIDIAQQQFTLGQSLILKPLFGCQGKGILKLDTISQLQQTLPVGDAFYLQQYIEPTDSGKWQDWRLMVVDGEVCAAMSRQADQWITNFAQGAVCFPVKATAEMQRLAIAATKAVQAEYAGVDLIRLPDGSYSVLEVNSVPAWKGLFQATGIDIAENLAQALAKRLFDIHNEYPSTPHAV